MGGSVGNALSRHVIVNGLNPALTVTGQWFERTLDDSANRRLSLPEGFLAVDVVRRADHDGINIRAGYQGWCVGFTVDVVVGGQFFRSCTTGDRYDLGGIETVRCLHVSPSHKP